MLKKLCYICSFISIFLLNAIEVEPFVHSFSPTADKAVIIYKVTNNSDEPVALSVEVLRRFFTKKGDKLVKDDNSFLVFPSQIIIKAKSFQMVKMKWLGNEDFIKKPDHEQAFRVQFKQYNLDLNPDVKQNTKGIKIFWCILTALYMTPDSAKEKVRVVSLKPYKANNLLVTVENIGTKKVLAQDTDLQIEIAGVSYPLRDKLNKQDLMRPIYAETSQKFIINK